jgi:hypothetical protein
MKRFFYLNFLRKSVTNRFKIWNKLAIKTTRLWKLLRILQNVVEKSFINWRVLPLVKINTHISDTPCTSNTGCRKMNVFHLVGKNLRNVEKIK